MPPRMRHDDVFDQGGIEVVVIDEDDNGAIVEDRVLFVPPRCGEDDEDEDENDFFDESVELTGNFFDQLLSGLGCAGCTPFDITEPQPKIGILKKPGDAHPLNSRNVSFSSLEIKEFDLTLGNVSSLVVSVAIDPSPSVVGFVDDVASQFMFRSTHHA